MVASEKGIARIGYGYLVDIILLAMLKLLHGM